LTPLALVQPGIDAAKKHSELTKGKSRHGLGPPHPHVWRAVLQAIIQAAKALEQETLAKVSPSIEVLEAYAKAYNEVPGKHLFFIRQARAKKLDNGMGLLSWQVSSLMENPSSVDRALITVLEVLKGDVRAGSAPPCPLERSNQKRIEVLLKRLGK